MLPLSIITSHSHPSSLTPFTSLKIDLSQGLPPRSPTDSTPITISELISSIPKETTSLYLDLSDQALSLSILQAALQNDQFSHIFLADSFLDKPFNLYQLLSSQQQPKISLFRPLRSHPKLQNLHQSLISNLQTGLSITFLSINSSGYQSTPLLDLLALFSNNQVLDIQGLTNPSHMIITGNLAHGGLYHLQLDQSQANNHTLNIEITLSNDKNLVLDLTSGDLDDSSYINQAISNPSNEEMSTLVRLASCVKKSIKTGNPVKIKALDSQNMVPFRTVGSAAFLMGGLFGPSITNKNVYVDGLFTNTTEKLREYFEFLLASGEPVSYFGSFEEIYKNPYGEKGVFYIPSLAGKRKDSEMQKALKAQYTVLAEKPAFANADLAKEFAKSVNEEEKKRLFFGWHYLHTPYYQRFLTNIDQGTHGKIKKIDVNLTVPMIYLNPVRMFEGGQGGVGLDSLCYCLHIAMRLAGFKENVKVLESEIKRGTDVYPQLDQLKDLDWGIKTQLEFSNGIQGSLSASFDSETVLSAVVEVTFEDGNVIRVNGFNHPHVLIKLRRTPILIKGKERPWEFYITEEEKAQEGYKKSTYEHQIEFIRRHVCGEQVYDFEEDKDGLGLDYNVKLQEVLDEIFVKGGIPKKAGA